MKQLKDYLQEIWHDGTDKHNDIAHKTGYVVEDTLKLGIELGAMEAAGYVGAAIGGTVGLPVIGGLALGMAAVYGVEKLAKMFRKSKFNLGDQLEPEVRFFKESGKFIGKQAKESIQGFKDMGRDIRHEFKHEKHKVQKAFKHFWHKIHHKRHHKKHH